MYVNIYVDRYRWSEKKLCWALPHFQRAFIWILRIILNADSINSFVIFLFAPLSVGNSWRSYIFPSLFFQSWHRVNSTSYTWCGGGSSEFCWLDDGGVGWKNMGIIFAYISNAALDEMKSSLWKKSYHPPYFFRQCCTCGIILSR